MPFDSQTVLHFTVASQKGQQLPDGRTGFTVASSPAESTCTRSGANWATCTGCLWPFSRRSTSRLEASKICATPSTQPVQHCTELADSENCSSQHLQLS